MRSFGKPSWPSSPAAQRYMDRPEDNPDGYRICSAPTYADQLRRPLLLIHGTTDDNVYFTNTLKLHDALFRAGKPHELLVLSGFTHMVPDPDVTTRLYERIVSFFKEHLAEGGEARNQTSPKRQRGPGSTTNSSARGRARARGSATFTLGHFVRPPPLEGMGDPHRFVPCLSLLKHN